MRPVIRVAAAVTALVAIGLGALQLWHGLHRPHGLFGPAAVASVPAARRLAAIDKAAGAFHTLTRGVVASGQPPRQSDPRVKALLDTVFDTKALGGAKSIGSGDFINLADWARQANRVGAAYVFAGTGITDPANLGKLSPAEQQRLGNEIDRNTATFAPEIGRYMDAELRITAAMIEAVQAALAADPKKYEPATRQHALDAMRAGFATGIGGALEAIATEGVSDSWRRQRVVALAAFTPAILAFFTPAERRSLHDRAEKIADKLGDAAAKSGLGAFARGLGG